MAKDNPDDAPQRVVDHGTPELRNHHIILQTPRRSYNISQNPIDFYFSARRCLSVREYDAAKKLMDIFDRSGIVRPTTPSYNLECRTPSHDPAGFAEGSMAARQQLRRIFTALGTVSSLMLLNVVCYGFFLNDEKLELPYYAKVKTRLQRFREALDSLADYLGIPRSDGNDKAEVDR